jgi:peptide-methionine (S)-S-oxide reductase
MRRSSIPFSAAFALAAAAIAAMTCPGATAAKSMAMARAAHSGPVAAGRDTAVFAGGCFWSMEAAFEGQPGVVNAVSGYSGGHVANPSYDLVTTETSGHRETVQVTFDPARTSYEKLLDIYWHSTNPTQADGQFCDHGDSYRPAIFYRTAAQRDAALASKQAIEASGVLHRPIVTEIRPAAPFYRAEEYHQDYAHKNPEAYHEYREGCGKDRSLDQLWGKLAQHHVG